MSKEKRNTYTATVQQAQKPKPQAERIPVPQAVQPQAVQPPLPKRTLPRGLVVAAELMLLAACGAIWGTLFTLRTCVWDELLLASWAVVLIGAAILLVRGEWRLAAARRKAEGA